MAPTTDYLSSGEGTFKGPSLLIGPNDSYAIVLGNDNTYKVVRLPYGGAAQTEALKFDATAAATFAGPVTILGGGALTVAGTVNLTGPVNISTGPLTVVTSGVTITAGGLAITAGGVTATGNSLIAGTFTAGSTATITTGGLQITAGGITATGNVTFTSATLTVGSTATITTGGLVLSAAAQLSNVPTPATTSGTAIPSAAGVITANGLIQRVTNSTTAVTSCAITTGTVDGQLLIVVNNGTTPIAFATQATSRIADAGTTLSLINQKQAKIFVWSGADTLWYPAGATAI